MIIVHNISTIPHLPGPIALTIGTFDGVHLGHQYIFKAMKKHGTRVVFTFSNHPSEILCHHKPHPLCSLEEKLTYFEKIGIDCTIMIPFTETFAHQPYDLFLKNLKKHLPFSTLVLGKGAAFGYKNRGDETHVKSLESQLSFQAIYLEKQSFNGEAISSKRIRELSRLGEYQQASTLLEHNKDKV